MRTRPGGELIMWEYQAQLGKVIDGDTVDLIVDCGFYTRRRTRIRLTGVDTAEIYGVSKESDEYEEGMRHRNFVEEWFSDGFVEYDGDWPFIVATGNQGKYGRWLGTIERKCDAKVLNEELIVEYPSVENAR